MVNISVWRNIAMSLLASGLVMGYAVGCAAEKKSPPTPTESNGPTALATFAGGCFWCMEGPFERLPGVRSVISGYTGGKETNPTYKQVSRGETGHTEAVQINFNPEVITYAELLGVFWRSMDPTDRAGQFADRGTQYRPEIFYHSPEQLQIAEASKQTLEKSGRFKKPIVVPLTLYTDFYAAEAYHQDYYRTHPTRYKRYRKGSGREDFLKRVWGNDPIPQATKRYTKPGKQELKKRLTKLQYHVTQEDGTERPFHNTYWNNKKAGIYVDVVSGEPLFSSTDKFVSGTGWPSFMRPLVHDNIVRREDRTLGVTRVELRSKHADSHLGHVFTDGPDPTGLRYCINSASLRFVPLGKMDAEGYSEFKKRVRKASR